MIYFTDAFTDSLFVFLFFPDSAAFVRIARVSGMEVGGSIGRQSMNVGILGAGAMGRTVVKHLQKCGDVQKIVAYDPKTASLERIRSDYGIDVHGALERILDDEKIKLVFVTAGNAAHKELTLAALQSGKAVMCEKPMALTLADSLQMAETAERIGGFLQIGFELRYSRLYATVKKWIDQGLLGEIRNIHCNYICSEYWGRDSWRVRQQLGGSMFGEKLSHYVDLPRWWTQCAVKEVYAAASPNVVPYFEIRDNYHATCKFASGAVSHLGFMMPFACTSESDPLVDMIDRQKDDGHELRYLVLGTEGAAETNVFQRKLKRWAFKETTRGFSSELVETLAWSRAEDHFYFHNTHDQSHDVVKRVRDGMPPSLSPWDALETMKVCEAAELSVEQGLPVRPDTLLKPVGKS